MAGIVLRVDGNLGFWYNFDNDKTAKKKRAWQRAHLGKCCEYSQKYRAANLGKVRLYNRLFKRRHQKQAAKAFRKWRFVHLSFLAAKASARRALERAARIGSGAAIAKIYARAHELRQWFDVVVDHKVPLSKGGAHSAENLQIIYAFENLRKKDRLDYFPQIVFS